MCACVHAGVCACTLAQGDFSHQTYILSHSQVHCGMACHSSGTGWIWLLSRGRGRGSNRGPAMSCVESKGGREEKEEEEGEEEEGRKREGEEGIGEGGETVMV